MGGFSIGNIEDIPKRVIDAIDYSDIVAVEWKHAFDYYFDQINKKPKNIIEYNGITTNYAETTKFLVEEAKNGKTILCLVDGGMPQISDPGTSLAILARLNNVEITTIPGPSIVTAALAVSGVDTHRFSFEPEIPELQSDRLNIFSLYKNYPHALVFIVNRNSEPERFKDGIIKNNFLSDTLEDMCNVFGPERNAALCFNITMNNEYVIRKTLKECLNWSHNNKNTDLLTIVIDGNNK